MAIGIASAVGAPHVETFGRRLFVRRFAPQFRELPLLFRRQFVFDSHEQRYLLSLDFPFRRQHLFQLRQYLLLVHARLLGQAHQFFHFILQLPLQFRELQLRLADFRLEIFFLLRAQANRFLMLNHQFRSKKTLPNRLLIRLHRNIQIRLAESRHPLQNLLPGSPQQAVAGGSPFCQFLRGGYFPCRNRWSISSQRCHANNQQRHNHDGCSCQCPHSPRPAALPFLRGHRCKYSRPEIRRGLPSLRHQRQQRIQSRRARSNLVQLSGAIRAVFQMLFKIPCHSPAQRSLQHLIFPFFALDFHFITSNKSFRAVCIRDLTVPAGTPSTAPTSAASISSTTDSCKTLRSFSGSRSISLRSRSKSTCCSAYFAPSTIAGVSVICQAESRTNRRPWPLRRFSASRKTIRFIHQRNFSASRSEANF